MLVRAESIAASVLPYLPVFYLPVFYFKNSLGMMRTKLNDHFFKSSAHPHEDKYFFSPFSSRIKDPLSGCLTDFSHSTACSCYNESSSSANSGTNSWRGRRTHRTTVLSRPSYHSLSWLVTATLSVLCILNGLLPRISLLPPLVLHVEAFAVTIDLHSNQKQCFGEQIGKHVLLMGEFRSDAGFLHVSVTGPSSMIFQDKNKEEIRTAFTTEQAGTHMFCILNLHRSATSVSVSILHGPEARDYSQIAKAEQLSEVVTGLIKVEDQLKLYHGNVLYMRDAESRMRATTDSTAMRVISFCIINVVLLVVAAAAQAYYFRNFFRSKKII